MVKPSAPTGTRNERIAFTAAMLGFVLFLVGIALPSMGWEGTTARRVSKFGIVCFATAAVATGVLVGRRRKLTQLESKRRGFEVLHAVELESRAETGSVKPNTGTTADNQEVR